jgi:outer membrane protein
MRLLLCAAAVLCAGPAAADTLADAIALAYRTNPTLESSRYDVRQADEGVGQALAELRPTLSVQLAAEYDRISQGATLFSGASTTAQKIDQAAATLTQPLYTSGKATADRRAAEASVRSAREGLRVAEGDLLLQVISAYVDVRRYTAELNVWKRSVTELEAIAKEIEARKIAGELTRTDIAQALSQLELAREQVIAVESQLEGSRANYQAVVGEAPGVLAPEPPLPQMPANADQAFDLAEQRSPELSQALFTEEASRQQVASVRATGRPSVSLRGSATLGGQLYPYQADNQEHDVSGTLLVNVPITTGGQIASQVHQAQERNNADRLRIEAARREMVRTISVAWNQRTAAERTVAAVERRRADAAVQLDGMIAEYRVGLRSTFEVLNAQETLRDAELEGYDRRRDDYLAGATLLRRVGLLEAGALMTGVSLYDPSRHLREVERRAAVPWEGAVAGLDGIAAAGPHQAALEQPAISPAPAISPTAPIPTAPDVVLQGPITPVPGTAGRPVPAPR